MDAVHNVAQRQILVLGIDGPAIASAADAADIVGQTFSGGARMVAIPVERLDASFFRLGSGLAGEVLQKFVNYGIAVAIIGDIDSHLVASKPLADFVRESNRGAQVWFAPDAATLEARLVAAQRI
jgi:hypothetical protein